MAKSLIQNDATIFREYFDEMLDFYGISAHYYQIKPGQKFTSAGELSANYFSPVDCKVIFDQVPKVQTLKKLGWVTELDQQQPIVHVSFNTPGIQFGCIYEIKDPLTPDKGRLFRVTKLSTGIIYPASVTCQLAAIVGTEPEETTEPYDGNKSIFLDQNGDLDEY